MFAFRGSVRENLLTQCGRGLNPPVFALVAVVLAVKQQALRTFVETQKVVAIFDHLKVAGSFSLSSNS